jgi:glycerol uptake facilitator-like aquaporin
MLPYILAQFAGGFAGAVNSHFMFVAGNHLLSP